MADEKPVDKTVRIAECREKRDVEGLLPYLAEGETMPVRRLAADALIAIGDGAALSALGTLVACPETGLSEAVLDHLASLRGANAARLIARGLGASDPIWRNRVVDTLQKRRDPEVFGLLLPACRDASGAVRQYVLRLVRQRLVEKPEQAAGLSPDRLEPILSVSDLKEAMGYLRKGPPSVRCAAAARVGALGTPLGYLALAEAFASEQGEVAEAALSALEEAQASPAAFFRPLLGHPEPNVRRRALEALVRREGAAARDALENALGDAEAGIRGLALRSLVSHVGLEAMGHVAGFLVDPDPSVRAIAVDLLVPWPGPETEAMLKLVTGDPDEAVRWRAFLALAKHGVSDPKLAPAYEKILVTIAARESLTSEDVDGLCTIAAGLAKLGGAEAKKALKSLVAAAKSSSLRLRRVAVEGILRYPPAQRAGALAELADTFDKSILKTMAIELGQLKDKRGIVPLIRVVDECGGRVGDQARGLLSEFTQTKELDFLIVSLKNRWASVRRYSAERLREQNDPRAIAPLLEALKDEDVELQFAAILALKKYAAEPRVTERLIDAIDFGDLSVRQTAAETLGEQKVTAAIPTLIRALSNPFIRPYAERALRDIGDRKGYLAVRRRQIREKYFVKKLKPAEIARKAEREKKSKIAGRIGLSVE
jgi:HEAT repeat protein